MNKAKITDFDYIDFLIRTQRVYSCTEAERVQQDAESVPSHDAFIRQLNRFFPSVARLLAEVYGHVDLIIDCLMSDDTTLDKFYSTKIEMMTHYWSGKHKKSDIRHQSDNFAVDGRRALFAC